MKTSTPDPEPPPPDGPVVTGAAELGASSLHHLNSPSPSVPDYELLRCIGRGSYGDVWLARNVLGQFRAVKFVYRSRFADPRPFEREFEGIQRFEPISRSHPSQLHILHVGKNDAEGCFYYVMELADDANAPVAADVRKLTSPGARVSPPAAAPDDQTVSDTSSRLPSGVAAAAGDSRDPKSEPPHIGCYEPRTLRHDLERHGRLPPADCVQIGLSLATALGHLHEQGLVHRDIKPSNVIFVNGVAKLGDIGLVTDAGDTQSIVGTEGYLPPEGPGTPQADLYSLGKVLYEISTGMDRRRFAELPDDVWTWPDSKAAIEFNEVVLKACAKDPVQRYQTAEQLRADLTMLREGKSVRRARGNQRLWLHVKKLALGLILLTLVVAGIVRMARQPQRYEAADDGPPSTNELANALVDKAMRLLRADESVGSLEIYTNLMRAVELDPNFARAYGELFNLLTDRTVPGLPPVTLPELRGIVGKLQKLAPQLASTHEYQSKLAYFNSDFPAAEKHALISIDAGPTPGRIAYYCFLLTRWGRSEEARQRLKAARAFRSSGGFIYRVMGHSYYVERDFTNAIAWYRQALDWEPRQVAAVGFLGDAYLAMQDYTNAFHYLARAKILQGGDPSQVQQEFGQYRRALAEGGDRGYWKERQRQAEIRPDRGQYERAVIQIHLGETNAALTSLYQCYEKEERRGVYSGLNYLLFYEGWDGLRGDRRFQELLNRIGYTKVMRE